MDDLCVLWSYLLVFDCLTDINHMNQWVNCLIFTSTIPQQRTKVKRIFATICAFLDITSVHVCTHKHAYMYMTKMYIVQLPGYFDGSLIDSTNLLVAAWACQIYETIEMISAKHMIDIHD